GRPAPSGARSPQGLESLRGPRAFTRGRRRGGPASVPRDDQALPPGAVRPREPRHRRGRDGAVPHRPPGLRPALRRQPPSRRPRHPPRAGARPRPTPGPSQGTPARPPPPPPPRRAGGHPRRAHGPRPPGLPKPGTQPPLAPPPVSPTTGRTEEQVKALLDEA